MRHELAKLIYDQNKGFKVDLNSIEMPGLVEMSMSDLRIVNVLQSVALKG